jgi:hypothetical protein
MNDECTNYCENNYYEGSCADGKIRYNNYCITPSCLTNIDCYKNDWNYNCLNAGTIDAYCSYFKCNSGEIVCLENGINKCKIPACKRNSDCEAGLVCQNAWECNAACVVSTAAPTSCPLNQYLCSGSCKNYEELCSWPSAPIGSNPCVCNESINYLFKKSETFSLIQLSANQASNAGSLSMLCSACSSDIGNCFNGKMFKLSYTISYNGSSSITAPMLELSKSYDYISHSYPSQIESMNDYFSGTINCNNNANLTLSSDSLASISDIKLFVESEEFIESALIANGNNYTSNVCPAFDKAEYKISFNIDSVSGNFSMNYGLEKNNKIIIFNQSMSNAIAKGIIDCSLSNNNNNITFAPKSASSSFTVSSVKLFIKGCNSDFDCAKNDFDTCSLAKCVSNKCQTSRINSDYCKSNKAETLINLLRTDSNDGKTGSYYLSNSSICEINNGKDYIINAEITSLDGELLVGYEADSNGNILTITSPQRLVISGKINCSKTYGAVIFYMPFSGSATSFTVSDFKMGIKDFDMAIIENVPEIPATPQTPSVPIVPTCTWPTTLNTEYNVCDMVSNDTNNLVINLKDMNTSYNLLGDKKIEDFQVLDFILCALGNSYNGKQFYLNYYIEYNGWVNINSGILGLDKDYPSLWDTTAFDEISGIIKCGDGENNKIILKNINGFFTSSSKFTNAILYIKKN